MINIINLFELEVGTVKKKLTAEELTALSIWLVEAINNRDVAPLYMQGVKFVYRRSTHADETMDFLYFAGQPTGMTMLWARELCDKIVALANKELLLDDVYPDFVDHPFHNATYQVKEFLAESNKAKLLAYVDTSRFGFSRAILPVALALSKDKAGYEMVMGQPDTNKLYYRF